MQDLDTGEWLVIKIQKDEEEIGKFEAKYMQAFSEAES